MTTHPVARALVALILAVSIGAGAAVPASAATEDPCYPGQVLRIGMRDSRCVQAVQTYLRWRLNTDLARDGDFGSTTKRAVVRYQRAMKISPDGVVGSGTTREFYREASRAWPDDGRPEAWRRAAGKAIVAALWSWGYAFN